MARLAGVQLAAPRSKLKMPLIEQEQAAIAQDLVASADVCIKDWQGPFMLKVDVVEPVIRLEFTCTTADTQFHLDLPIQEFKKIVKDYVFMVETYENAQGHMTPDRLEAIDMGRRALHNEGSDIVNHLLDPDVQIDYETARRLFTLISIVLIGHNVS